MMVCGTNDLTFLSLNPWNEFNPACCTVTAVSIAVYVDIMIVIAKAKAIVVILVASLYGFFPPSSL